MSEFHETNVPPGVRVMVIDPELEARDLLRMLFEASHHWPNLPAISLLYEVASGEEALERLGALSEDRLPHLIICAAEMSGMDGWQTVCQLRMQPRLTRISILMASRRASQRDLAALVDQYCLAGLLNKPFDARQVVKVIGDALRTRLPLHHVLVVANDYGWETQKTARAILEQHGYTDQILSVSGPAQANALLRSAELGVGCIIFDAGTVLEQFDGYAAMHAHAERTGTPMICLGDDEAHRIWAAGQEVRRYCMKPIAWGDLLTELGKLVPPQAAGVPRVKLTKMSQD